MTRVVVWLLLLALASCMIPFSAHSQVHQHPTETITGATAEFYETWYRPDAPSSSCCSEKDCYATPARMEGGKVMALHRETGKWIEVRAEAIEQNRVSPDGRNHLCATAYEFVFCFVWGGGA